MNIGTMRVELGHALRGSLGPHMRFRQVCIASDIDGFIAMAECLRCGAAGKVPIELVSVEVDLEGAARSAAADMSCKCTKRGAWTVPPLDHGRMLRAFGALAMRVGHLDNTGAPCRIDWNGHHDACGICEAIGAVLAKLRECGIDADTLTRRMPDLSLADMRAAERSAP